ncbi:MAG: AraC family transcriptional regulator [Chitinophagaceae bacterium]|nr:MAG: AraC family transcriptional regulator [Chitinophagaceae bacterium]
MNLFIKYMVSIRCKMAVHDAFTKLGISYQLVNLGEVSVEQDLSPLQRTQLQAILSGSGLELVDDKRAILIERIKSVIVQMVHHQDDPPKTNFSVLISDRLKYDYTYLSNLFSEHQGRTIEQYIMLHKIEKIKSLIIHGELNLTEIAGKMHYSGVSHLSKQFKKITGITPSFFKLQKHKKTTMLEDL